MYLGPLLLIVLLKKVLEPIFFPFIPFPNLEKSKPILKKSLVIKLPPPDIHGVPNLSVPIYNPSSNPVASTVSNSHCLKLFLLTFSTISPITSVLADL